MKVYINRQPISGPWGGGAHFINAFHDIVPKTVHSIVPPDSIRIAPDVILLAGLDNDGHGISAEQAIQYKWVMEAQGKDVKIVVRVNECDARKNTTHVDPRLLALSSYVDGTVFVSNWMRDYFLEKGWVDSNIAVIINGVDSDVFRPQPKLNNGKLNIVAHHWSDNPMKGFDIYERIDEFVGQNSDRYAFTYIGRDRQTFKHTNVVRPLFGKKLGEELGKHDVYVSASRFDPGPNHIIESIACGLQTYVHKDGGGCVEFAGEGASFSCWDELKTLLTMCEPGMINTLNRSFMSRSWHACIQDYIGFLEATCRQKKQTT